MAHRNFLFDLDGTLVDSQRGIVEAAAQAVAAVLPGRPIPDLRPFIGPPIREIFRRSLGIDDPVLLARLTARYRSAYDEEGYKFATLYDGVGAVLRTLADRRLSCCIVTNKPIVPTERMLVHLGIRAFFSDVAAPDSEQPHFDSKAQMVRALLERAGLLREDSVLIGDSEDDAQAAFETGISFMAVAYGYGSATQGSRYPCIAKIVHISQILN
jgi:phosphoglycolate phosphatase